MKNETLGQKIKYLRMEKGLTQIQFANIFHLDKSTIAKYETDKIVPNFETIKKFAVFFNVSMDYFAGFED